ncbi:hypothetical protein BegalDRAFT_0558 [Beggiatoa alba B18LD]|uniref:Uncharacterized protein n=1 Tax=Beggiatoa alba B18LD TaxID=395493 RepID=I3CCY3_9GAMM|nr:hypothetical protein [Beggiatoa alba]EIJ41476.1 hypothetical protein BegalDRAFT_0558 [Beggiatoa alba B18LD]
MCSALLDELSELSIDEFFAATGESHNPTADIYLLAMQGIGYLTPTNTNPETSNDETMRLVVSH